MVEEQTGSIQDIKALQSSILVLSQKIKYLVHNEKILGRNILILNKKIASASGTSQAGEGAGINSAEVLQILEKQKALDARIKQIEATLELFSKRYARNEELKEMKYIIDNINPLEYTTVAQVKKIIKDTPVK
jgi:AICAR transformylase/IMP cyclohydrolase PurH